MIYPQSFLIHPQEQAGDVYATEFTFRSNFPPQYTRFAWELGDRSKIIYNESKVQHIYNYPGLYTVGLSAWTDYGEFAVDSATINVDYPYRDSLTFTQIPSTFGVPGTTSDVPFTVSLTSSKINQPISLVLHSHNSKAVPHFAAPEKWKFIIPKWRFVDVDLNVLGQSVELNTTPVYKNGRVVAVKADYSFYYIDDVSTDTSFEADCPILVIASLSTENFTYPPESIIYPYASYSNNQIVQAVTVCQLSYCIPTSIKVTENFIDEIYPIKWKDVSIPVMLTIKCDSSKLSSYAIAENAPQYNIDSFSYPINNELGKVTPVTIALSAAGVELLPNVHYKMDDPVLYFQHTDTYGNMSGGYIFTSITPLTSIGSDMVVKANTIANNASKSALKYGFGFPLGYPLYYSAYISHSLENLFYKLTYAVDTGDCPFVKFYKALDIFASGSATIVPTPSASESGETLENYTLPLTGHGNVYALSFSPIKNRLYTADIDFNTVSCYSKGTNLLSAVNLEHLFNKSSLGPASISIDGRGDIWVSLLDDRKVIKFDYNLNYLLSAVPYPEFEEPLRTSSWLEPKKPTFSPPVIETDKENCVWVCYPSYEMPSRLYKFSSTGVTILSADLPENAVPISLSIGNDNSVWVACKNTNEIIAFQSDGKRLSSDGVFSPHLTKGIVRPSYICHDNKGNLCILHGYNLYSYYDMYANRMKTWEVDFAAKTTRLVSPLRPISNINYNLDKTEIWGGISVDVYDRMWILDSESNRAGTSTPGELSGISIVPLNPERNAPYTTYIIKGGETTFVSLSVNQTQAINIGVQRSVQAGGDWTGNRWYQKYASGLYSMPIEGTSTPFKVYDLDNSFNIAKVNETWNYADYFKSLAYPEILQTNESLYTFIGAAAGDGTDLHKNLGSTSYEKIANFVSNHSDVDTANTNSLYSISQQLGAEMKDYASGYPVGVKRLIDLFSINKKYLFGTPNIETDPVKKTGALLNSNYSDTAMITADSFYFLKHKQTNSTRIFYANRLGDLEVYSIDLLNISGLISPISKNYYVFTYKESMPNEETPWIGNLIDWTNTATTLGPPTSASEDWYKDQGIVETMFNNLLTKQLFGK